MKTVEPKTIYTFELGGEYYLQVRDVTSRYGDPSFRYRVLIRPQASHVGDVVVEQEQINLARGGAKKLTVTTDQEEGFGGEIALKVEGLPPGVDAVTGTEVRSRPRPPVGRGPQETIRAQVADSGHHAGGRRGRPAHPMAEVYSRCSAAGGRRQIGPAPALEEIPLMVVESGQTSSGD